MRHRTRAIIGSAFIFGVSCVITPLIAYAVINQDWQFEIESLDVVYKPWRLFIVACTIPGLISAVALIFVPESPKFVLGQGNKNEAIDIIKTVNRWNNGKNSKINIVDIFEEAESVEHRQRILETKQSRYPLMKAIWNQTAPFFKPPYLGPTLLLCTLQFVIYYTSNGYETRLYTI